MCELREELRVGLQYLEDATTLLQRIRNADPIKGLYEASDLHWWWRQPRATDEAGQLIWFDDNGVPEAAVIITDWGDRVALDPMFMPDASPDTVAHVVARGLEHAAALGFVDVELEVSQNDDVLRDVLLGRGFSMTEEGFVIEA